MGRKAEDLQVGMVVDMVAMVELEIIQQYMMLEVAVGVPEDRLLIETDSPFLSPEPFRGRRNEPAHLVHTARCLAIARGESLEQFAAATAANARRLFLKS